MSAAARHGLRRSPLDSPLGLPTLTSTTWADHVLDLRRDQTQPLPQPTDRTLPGRFGTFVLDGHSAPDPALTHLHGWRIEFSNPAWPNETGFEAAVFVPPSGTGAPRAAIVYQDDRNLSTDNKWIAKDSLGLPRTIGERTVFADPSALRIPMTHAAIVDPTTWLGPISITDAQNHSLADPAVLQRLPLWVSPHWRTWQQAQPWIQAGFAHPQDAMSWRAQFEDATAAAAWKDAQVGWPEQCRALAEAGWSPLQGKRLVLALTHNARESGIAAGQWSGIKDTALSVLVEITHQDGALQASREKVLRCLRAGMGAQEIADLARLGRLDGLDDEVLTAMAAMRRPVEDRT